MSRPDDSKRQNDRIGAVAGYCVIACIVAVLLGVLALAQAQDAIDAAQAEMIRRPA